MFEKVLIKYNGQLHEFRMADLDVDQDNPTDADLRQVLADQLNAPHLNEYVVDRADTVINVRPAATYG